MLPAIEIAHHGNPHDPHGRNILHGRRFCPYLESMRLQLVLLVLGMVSSACGGSGKGNDGGGGEGNEPSGSSLGTCGLRSEVSGGATIHFTGQNDVSCATLHSSGTGLDAVFSGLDAKGSLELVVDDVTEGETGSDFPSRIVVTSTARETWQGTGCLTSLSEHHLLSTEASTIGELRHYQVTGVGTCPTDLASFPAGGVATTVGPFAFRAEFTWRD
jgi:hypothetical protein